MSLFSCTVIEHGSPETSDCLCLVFVTTPNDADVVAPLGRVHDGGASPHLHGCADHTYVDDPAPCGQVEYGVG